MKRFFALFLAITVLAVSLPLALFVGAQQPDFDEILKDFENTPYKTFFDNNTAINSIDGVMKYSNVKIANAALSVREGNYLIHTSTTDNYVIISVDDEDAVETGLVIHKDRLNDTSLKFYTTTDSSVGTENWTAISDSTIAISQDKCVRYNTSDTLYNTAYYLRKQRFTNLPEGTKYLKIVINTTQTWQPGLDYVDLYKVDKFKTALDGYESTPVKTYFDDSKAITDVFTEGDYSDVVTRNRSGTLGGRTSTEWGLSLFDNGSSAYPYVIIPVTDTNIIETGLVINSGQTGNANLVFYTSADKQSWQQVSATNIFAAVEDNTTVTTLKAGYLLRRQRVTNLPEGTKYLKVYIDATNWWFHILDYIDIYRIDDFDDVLDGYEGAACKTYFDVKGQALDAIFADSTYYNGIEMKERGISVGGRTNDGAYGVSVVSTANPYIIIPVNDSNVIETGFVIEKSNTTNAELIFYTSSDKENWTQVSYDNISTSVVDNNSVSSLNASFYLRKQRVSNLPVGTKYVKIYIRATNWWFNLLDYVDVYKVDNFSSLLNGYESTAYKTFFDTKGEALDKIFADSSFYNDIEMKERGSSVGGRTNDGAYGVSVTASNPYVIIPVDDNNVIETGFVIEKTNTANAELIFYTSSDKENWHQVSYNDVAAAIVDNSVVSTLNENYYLRKQRISNLPEGTKYLKVYIRATSWWFNLLDYIDVYKPDKFDSALNGYETEPVKTYFNDNTQIDAKGYVAGFENVKVLAQGLSACDKDYLKAETADGGWVAIKIEDTNVIETGLVVNKTQGASTYLEFYTSTDMSSWTAVNARNISASEADCTIGSGNSTDYCLRRQRLYNLPEGTKYLKVKINTAVAWQPGLDYIKVYEKVGTAEVKAKIFDNLTDGYKVVKSILSESETLDSTTILSYDNWRFTKDSFPYRDVYATQRPNNKNGDAQLVLSVSDDTVIEVGTVLSQSRLTSSYNTYYASADGKKWTLLGEDSVYIRELDSTAKKPAGYVGLKADYVARIERIVRLPEGTTQLKIVTSTDNAANSWWQPGIEYIDLYEPITEIKLDGEYELQSELITKDSKLDNEKIQSYSNWKYIDNGVKLEDKYSLAREKAENAEIVLKISKDTPVMVGYTVPTVEYDKLISTYYSSVDGNSWTKIGAENIISRKISPLVCVNLTSEYTGRQDLIIGLADSVKYVKAVTEFEGSDPAYDVQINYIKLYKEYINPFDTVLDGYRVVETLLTPTNTIEAQTIIGYENWRFGKMGLPFFDDVGTQRHSNNSADANIIISVDDTMAVEVATVIAKSLEGCTSNTYYTSSDGVNWTVVPTENVYSKRFVSAEDNLLTTTTIGLIERVVELPKGTTMVKIVTSTENKVNSWWQPSINRIALYKDPFDSSVDGNVIVDKAITPESKLGSERIVSASNWEYANAFSYINDGGAVRKNSGEATMVLSVVDSMTVEVATVASDEVYPHTYYTSPDGKSWTALSADNIHSRVFWDTDKLSGGNKATVQRLDNLPEGTIYLKIVSSGSGDFSINYINFYDSAVDKFDLAFVGYGCTDSLFNATRKLNDSLVTSYENWRYGTNGYSYTDVYSLQREKDNAGDANLVLSVKDNQLLEYGTIISNSWLKKSTTEYYVSTDGAKWTKLSDASVLKRYYTPEDDSRVKEGYNVLIERIVDLPENTAFIKQVVSTANAVNSWWQPSVDYVDIYSPFEELDLEQIAAQSGDKGTTIQFTSDEDGLKNSYVYSSKNLISGKFGLKYTDEYSTRRVGYNDSELILSVDEDLIIEIGTLIDKSLEHCAENKYYTSVDGEAWTPFDAGMLLNAKITEGVSANMFARVQLLSELPSDTKYVKIVGTTNGVTDAWKNFGIDYITIYKGSSDFKIKKPLDNPQIMVVGNFMTIMLQKNQKFTVDDLTERIDSGKLLIYYYTADDKEIYDGTTQVEDGQKLVLKRNNKAKKEYIISISYVDGKPTDANDNSGGISIPLIVGLSVGGAVIIAGAIFLVVFLKRRKLRA